MQHIFTRMSIILITYLCVHTGFIHAQTNVNTTLIGKWGEGGCRAVAGEGSYAYYGHGSIIDVVDIGNPDSPVRIGSLETGSSVQGLCISGSYLYAACYTGSVQIIDVSDPSQPVIIGSVALQGKAIELTRHGDYLYVGCKPGMAVIDVSDAAHPAVIGTVSDNRMTSENIEYDNNYCFVPSGMNGMFIVDVATPSNPRVVSSVVSGFGQSSGVAVYGNRAYLCDYGSSIRIVDISDILAPKVLKSVHEFGYSFDLYMQGTTLFVAGAHQGLRVLSAANPDSLVQTGHIAIGGTCYKICVAGSTACIAVSPNGCVVASVADPSSPSLVTTFPAEDKVAGIALQDQYAYAACGQTGIAVLDISNPAHPQKVSSIPGKNASDIEIVGQYAYICDWTGGFMIADISTPSSPVIVSRLESCLNAESICISGNHAFVSCNDSGLRVIDISNPQQPAQIAQLKKLGLCKDIACNDNSVFLIQSSEGFRIFDHRSLPSLPQIGDWHAVELCKNAIAVEDTLLAFAGRHRLQMWSVADPAAPVLISEAPDSMYIQAIAMKRPYVIVSGTGGVVHIYDCTDPANLKSAGVYMTGAIPVGLAIRGDTAVIADYYDGVYIVHCAGMTTGIPAMPPAAGLFISVYPNPASMLTTIEFTVESMGLTAVDVFDERGVRVTSLAAGWYTPGVYTVEWNPAAAGIAPGIYYVRFAFGEKVATKQIAVVK